MKLCSRCNEYKTLDSFSKNKTRNDGLSSYCKDCSNQYNKQYYNQLPDRKSYLVKKRNTARDNYRKFIYDYLSKHSCVDCGETNVLYLEFDHVKGDKSYNISAMDSFSVQRIQEEIDKCEIRCVKCHRLKTAIEFNWWILEYIKNQSK